MSRPTYTKEEEERIIRRVAGRVAEMGVYLMQCSTADPTMVSSFQVAQLEGLMRLHDLPAEVRALHVRNLEVMYPETPTPAQAAIGQVATAVGVETRQRQDEVARFHAEGGQGA